MCRRLPSPMTTSGSPAATRATPTSRTPTCRAPSRSRTPLPGSCRTGKRVLVVAHGNSLRALVKYLDGISDDEIVGLNIPTGVPFVYELDDALRPVGSRYLGDPARVAAAAA